MAAGPGIAAHAAAVLDTAIVALPTDVPIEPAPTIGPWHHAPAGATQRRRALDLVAAVEAHGCTTAVVDVSMEVTVLARLLGLRLVTVRQSGRRDDAPHRIGFASADVVWVPQHRDLEPLDGPPDERWSFTGAFSRFDDAPTGRRVARCGRRAVLLVGAGGTSFRAEAWRAVLGAGRMVGHHRRDAGPVADGRRSGASVDVDDVQPVLRRGRRRRHERRMGCRRRCRGRGCPLGRRGRGPALRRAGDARRARCTPPASPSLSTVGRRPTELPDVLGAAARLDPGGLGRVLRRRGRPARRRHDRRAARRMTVTVVVTGVRPPRAPRPHPAWAGRSATAT